MGYLPRPPISVLSGRQPAPPSIHADARYIDAGVVSQALFQQLSGVEAAVYYTPEVLKAAGPVNQSRKHPP